MNSKCRKIKLVLFDVDGVMTDGSIYINEQGECFKVFNAKDGIAIELLRSHNILTGVISGKSSPSLDNRCKKLGFDEVITGCKNKLPILHELCNKYALSTDEVAFLGDDILDLMALKTVGLSIVPADAHSIVKEYADLICNSYGGRGMVREAVDFILTKKTNQPLLDIYEPLLSNLDLDKFENIEQ